ncbi:MAG: thioredoxin domain-containing protein [Bacteroidota bacterium]
MIKIQNKISAFIFIALVNLANFGIIVAQTVSVEEFQTKISAINNPQLIDVRSPDEFKTGHLIASKNVNVKDADFAQQIEKLDKTLPVFVYCLTGLRSKLATEIFSKSGFVSVIELEGGYSNWIIAKKPIESPAKALNTSGKYSKEELVDLIKENKLVLIDYFAEWCGPCKKMDPFIQKLKKEFDGKVKVIKIDTDKNRGIAIQNLVSELPTVVFYKNGREFWRGVGEQDEEFIRELFELNVEK